MLIKFCLLLSSIFTSSLLLARDGIRNKQTADTSSPYKPIIYNTRSNDQIPSSDYRIVQEKLEHFTSVIVGLYPRPVNVVIKPHGGIEEENNYLLVGTEFKNSPYIMKLYFAFYNILGWNDDEPVDEGESAYGLKLWMNSARFILQTNSVHYGNNLIFAAPSRAADVKSFPKYNNLVVITRAGKGLPWIDATRQQYLENAIIDLKQIRHVTEKKIEYKYLLKAMQLLSAMTDDEKKEPAVLEMKPYGGYVEFFDAGWKGFKIPGEANTRQLVIADEMYFDDRLPKSSIQLIAIERSSSRTVVAMWKDDLKGLNRMLYAPGVLEAMQALLAK
jgi:hypothetical protein